MNNFFSNAFIVAQQVIILFIMIGLGGVLIKRKFLSQEGTKQMTTLLLWVVTPCVIINSFLEIPLNSESLTKLGLASICALVVHIIGVLVSIIVFRNSGNSKSGIFRFAVIFSNCGFMSIPLVRALFGDSGVFLMSAYIAIFNLLAWTYGIKLFKNSDDKITFKKAILNPGVIGIAVALPIFLLNIKLPMILSSPINSLSMLNTPLAMIITGAYLANSSLKFKKDDLKLWISIILRLLVVPLITLLVLKLLNISRDVLMICMIPISAPSATNLTLFAAMFDSDAELSSRIVSFCTIFSILTLPLLASLSQL